MGNGAFALESWVRSASRFIRGHLLPFAGCFQTAEDCRYHNGFTLCLCEHSLFYRKWDAFGCLFAEAGRVWFSLGMRGFPAQVANAFPLWLLIFSGLAMWRLGLWVCDRGGLE